MIRPMLVIIAAPFVMATILLLMAMDFALLVLATGLGLVVAGLVRAHHFVNACADKVHPVLRRLLNGKEEA